MNLPLERKIGRLTAQEFRELRKSVPDLSTYRFARWLDIGRQQISRWENGRRPVPAQAEILLRLLAAEYFGRPMRVRDASMLAAGSRLPLMLVKR